MELAVVGTYASSVEANVVRARLESEGISAIVRADDIGATTPTLTLGRGVEVLVRAEDLAIAKERLERMLPG